MSLCGRLVLLATLVRLSLTAQPSSESDRSFNKFKTESEVAVGSVAESSLSSDEVCPFTKPCICFAGRIICAPAGRESLQQLNSISSDAARKITWYDLRIERLDNIDYLPSPATLSVKNLHITRSMLFFVPVGILSELTGVSQLNLSKNRIGRLRDNDFVGVPSLQQLDLAQNLLRVIDKNSFVPLPELRQLNLAMNSLLAVPVAVRSLRKLTHLDLHGNPIKVILDYDFNHLGRLLNLDLSQLSPGLIIKERAFCGLHSVRRMGDQIKLETGLNSLKLRDNNISKWDPCSLFHLNHIVRSVDFRRTTLRECTCNAASLHNYFRLTYRGTDLINCVSRRRKDAKCANISCTSYCSSSIAATRTPLALTTVTIALIFCLVHEVIASYLDQTICSL